MISSKNTIKVVMEWLRNYDNITESLVHNTLQLSYFVVYRSSINVHTGNYSKHMK